MAHFSFKTNHKETDTNLEIVIFNIIVILGIIYFFAVVKLVPCIAMFEYVIMFWKSSFIGSYCLWLLTQILTSKLTKNEGIAYCQMLSLAIAVL